MVESIETSQEVYDEQVISTGIVINTNNEEMYSMPNTFNLEFERSKIPRSLEMYEPKLYLAIQKVDVFPNMNNPRAVEITFENGDKFRAECCKGDVFDLETGISICITKSIIAAFIGKATCTREYNRFIRQAVKVYKQGIKDKAAAEEEKKRIENRKKKAALKKQRRKERKQKEQAEMMADVWKMFSDKVVEEMMNEPCDLPNTMMEEANEED